MAVYDDQKTDLDTLKDLENAYNTPSATESGSDKLARDKETRDLQAKFDAPAASESGSDKLDTAQQLASKEAGLKGINTYGGSSDDTVGKGYSGLLTEGAGRKRKLKGVSNLFSKKRIAVATMAGGGVAGFGLLGFFLFIPLKMDHMLSLIETRFSAQVMSVMDKQTETLIGQYFAKSVLPAMQAGRCKSTIDINCVPNSMAGNSPIAKTYNAWKGQKLERKLAEKTGYFFGRDGTGFYINHSGQVSRIKNSEFTRILEGKVSIFDAEVQGTSRFNRAEFRKVTREMTKDMTKRDRLWYRLVAGPYIEKKYGFRRCMVACNARDNFADKMESKWQFKKAAFVQRVVSPRSQEMGIVLECFINKANCGIEKPDATGDTVTNNGVRRETNYRRDLSNRLLIYREKYGREALEDMLKKVKLIEDGGLGSYTIRNALEKAFGVTVSKEALSKVLGPTQWVLLGAAVVSAVDSAGDISSSMSYAINAGMTGVPTYMAFKSSADEQHGGKVDFAMNGSIASALSEHDIDASDSLVYQDLSRNGTNSATASLPFFGSTAYAAGSTSKYRCQDKKPVPLGKRVCREMEVGKGGNEYALGLSETARSIPGWPILKQVADFINGNIVVTTINAVLGWITEGLVKLLGLGSLIEVVTKIISPLLSAFTSAMIINSWVDGSNADSASNTSSFENSVQSAAADPSETSSSRSGLSKLFTPTVTAQETAPQAVMPSGARMFELAAMGADVMFNESCMEQMGCARVNDTVAAAIQEKYRAEQMSEFQQRGLIARLFDRSSQYSLVSRIALDTPSSVTSVSNNTVASLMSPLRQLGTLFTMFAPRNAIADTTQDPFYVPQSAILDSQIDAIGDQEAFWNANCTDGTYNQRWLESQQWDAARGVMYATTPNYCLLIQTTTRSLGGMFDATLLP